MVIDIYRAILQRNGKVLYQSISLTGNYMLFLISSIGYDYEVWLPRKRNNNE